MPSLREILDKQKQEALKSNGSTKPVLQPQAVKETIQEKKPESGETLSGKSTGTEERVSGSSSILETVAVKSNSVVDQVLTPPPGLSGLALLKWKKTNASVANNGPQNLPTTGEKITSQNVEIKGNNVPTNSTSDKLLSGTKTGNENLSVAQNEKINEKQNNGVIGLDELHGHLTFLANNIEQKELVAQVVRTIAVQLKNSPELAPFMKDSDVDLVVRGMRMAYNVAAKRRSEAKESKTKTKVVDAGLDQMFKAAGLDLSKLG